MVRTITCDAGDALVEILNPLEHMQKSWVAGRFYEEEMLSRIHCHYSGGIFIDAGSSIGNHTLFFAKFCNPDLIVSIEPVPDSLACQFDILQLNGVVDRVQFHCCALSDQHGKGRMENFAPEGHINVGMYRLHFDSNGDTAITTLDSFAFYERDEPVTLIKIDVEYHQMEVLRGAVETIKKHQPALFVECPTKLELEEVKAFLGPIGYKMYGKYNATPTYEFIVP